MRRTPACFAGEEEAHLKKMQAADFRIRMDIRSSNYKEKGREC